MVWTSFVATERDCASCLRTDYEFQGPQSALVHAVIQRAMEDRLTSEVMNSYVTCAQIGTKLPPPHAAFVHDAFDGWGNLGQPDDDAIKGDIAEIKFLSLRQEITRAQPVVHRPKREALSSKTSGWDLLEIFLENEPWFILWEIKGTDQHPQTQSRHACEQLRDRCQPWLAKLSKLLEEELGQSHGDDAARFGARIHEMAFKRDKSFHVGIAVVVDQGSLPGPSFEMFDHGSPDDARERKWGIIIGVPGFKDLREEVVQWIRDLL